MEYFVDAYGFAIYGTGTPRKFSEMCNLTFLLKSANSWAHFAIANPLIFKVCSLQIVNPQNFIISR